MSEKTDAQKEEEKMIKEIEGKIDEVIELLSLQKDFSTIQKDFQMTQDMHGRTRGDKDLTFMKKDKAKNIAVTKHAHWNLEMVEATRLKKKFSQHPVDLLSHLDSLTDRLLMLVQKQSKRKNH